MRALMGLIKNEHGVYHVRKKVPEKRTHPVKAAETAVDGDWSIRKRGYAAAFCARSGFQFQGRSSPMRLAG
jgi:hypothetical protein